MAKYKEQRNINNVLEAYVRNSDNTSIPIAVGNRHYQEALAWIADGNTPDPDDTLPGRIAQAEVLRVLNTKKNADIEALGTRSAMQAEAASANSVPALRNLVLKLAEIVYSREVGTID